MTDTEKPISGQERAELRALIRARSKSLKLGIEARKADQRAEVERRINAHHKAQRAAYGEAEGVAKRIVAEANQKIQAVYAPIVGDHPEWASFALLKTADPPSLERELMRKRADREVEASAKAAQARLIHWEAEALETVARAGIRSEEAVALLEQVATVEQLMPAVAMLEAAASTVDEMATDEGKAPYLDLAELKADKQLRYSALSLEYHARDWGWRPRALGDGTVIDCDDDEDAVDY